MNIFFFIIGAAVGFGAKLGADKYNEWQNEQQKNYLKMEQILIDWKAIEKMKELDK